MKRRVIISMLILAFFLGARVAAQETYEWNLSSYVEAYLEASSILQDQIEKIDDLQAELDTATIRKESAFSLAQRELQLDVAVLAKREVENGEVIKAVDLYIAYVNAHRALEVAETSLETTLREYSITENRFNAQEETERDLQNARVAVLQAEKSLASGTSSFARAENALVRPLSLQTKSFDPLIAWDDSVPSAVVLEDASIRASSSNYYQAVRSMELSTEEVELKSKSDVFTTAEVDAARDSLEKAEENLRLAEWNLIDTKSNLEFELIAYAADLEIAEINLALSETDLETVALQFEYGEVLEVAVEGARAKVKSAFDGLEGLRENLFTLHLEAEDFAGGSVMDVIDRWTLK